MKRKPEDISLLIVSDGIFATNGRYLMYIGDDGTEWCTCPGYVFHKKECKHLRMVKEMAISRRRMKKKKDVERYFPSSIRGLNDMFVGGGFYSSRLISGVFGLPGIGKSLLMIQDAYWLISQGYKVLFIDTEGSLVAQLDNWEDIFVARFGIDEEQLDNLYIESVKKLEDLMEYLGVKVKLKLKGGKVEVDAEDMAKGNRKYGSQFEKDILENEIDVVILDSITNPIRMAIPPSVQNNPAKSFIEGKIIEKLMIGQEKRKCGVCVVLQASFNPASYGNEINYRGGLSIRYNVKRVVGMMKRDKKELENIRMLWMVRGEKGKPYSNVTFVKISDLGLDEIEVNDEDELMRLLTKSQYEMLKGGGLDEGED